MSPVSTEEAVAKEQGYLYSGRKCELRHGVDLEVIFVT